VNPARRKKKNPESASDIPWKTIVATTVVTSIVSTFAVTFARFLMERARERRAASALTPAQQQPQLASAQQPPQPQFPNPHALSAAPPRTLTPVMPTHAFQANPFATSNVQRPMALPQPPHVSHEADSEAMPSWFAVWKDDQDRRRDDQDRRLAKLESAQRRDR
jgi:hypothetical protein